MMKNYTQGMRLPLLCIGIMFILFISCPISAVEDNNKNNNNNSSAIDFFPYTNYTDTIMHSIPTIQADARKTAVWNGFNARKQRLIINNACGSDDKRNSCPNTILAKDLDNDGDIDLVLTNTLTKNQSAFRASSPYFHILKNDGSGVFVETERISRTVEEYISDITDINGDGIVDLVGYNFFGNKGFIKLGEKRDGISFNNVHAVPSGAHGGETYILDYDYDGKRDIISFSSGSAVLLKLHIYKNTGLGFTYIDAHTGGVDSSFHVNAKPIGDVNGDRIEDFIYTEQDWQYVRFIISTSSNSYKTIESNLHIDKPYIPWTEPEAYGDFVIFKNADNKSNLAYIYNRIRSGGSGIYVEYTINADGSTTQNKSIATINAGGVYSPVIADINSDGLMDVIYIAGNGLYYRLQNAGGGFNTRISIQTTLTGVLDAREYISKTITLADYNGDGKDDVAVITIGASTSEVAIYLAR